MDKSILMARRENQLQIATGHEETPETVAISGVLVAAVRNIFYPKSYSDIWCRSTSVNERI